MPLNYLFKNLIEKTSPCFTLGGFKKKGDSFVKSFLKAEASFKFRKSRESTSDELVVTCSLAIRYFIFDKYHRVDPPMHMQFTAIADKTILCRELAGENFEGYWRIRSEQDCKSAAQHVVSFVPNVLAIAEKYSSEEAFIAGYLESIKSAEKNHLKINEKAAVVVATYFLEKKDEAAAEDTIQRLKALSKTDENMLKIIDMTWAYIRDRNVAN